MDKLEDRNNELSFANGFGIIDYENLTPLFGPEKKFERPGGLSLLRKKDNFLFKNLIDRDNIVVQLNKLIALFSENKDFEYRIRGYRDEIVTTLLAQRFDYVYSEDHMYELSPKERFRHLPLADIWKAWYTSSTLNDIELMVCLHSCQELQYPYQRWQLTKEGAQFMSAYIPDIKGLHLKPQVSQYQSDPVLGKMSFLLSVLIDAFADIEMIGAFKLDVLEDMMASDPPDLLPNDDYKFRKLPRQPSVFTNMKS